MKMTDEDLLAFLDAESDSATDQGYGDPSRDRERSLREYLRLPYGNEDANASQVVASDVFDSVEGMLPDLIEVFASTDEAVRFDPVGPEDEEGAEQATQACNYVFYKQNNGFMLLYTAAKDALMMKTGGVKWYWEEKRTPTFTTYANVPELQLAYFMMANPEAEVLSQEEGEPDQMGVPTITVKVKTVETKGKVRIVNVPPDELEVSRRHNSILVDECQYIAHRTKKSLSEIHEMGFTEVTEDDVKAAQDDDEIQADRELRDQLNGVLEDETHLTGPQAQGWIREIYALVDFDGDGIAERRRIIRLGQKILENVETSHVQMAAWTPYILTHQFNGISVADLVSDFQRINTDVWRQSLDNLYLANNQNTVVLTDAQGAPMANIDDLLNRFPGSIIREKAAGAVRPYVERWQGIEAGPMMEMVQAAKENRTGYTRYSQGLDANSLNKTAHGIQQIMNASQKRMKLMARIMAEAMVAPMFRGIFKTLTDYCMEKLSFRLNGKFVAYDPQEWRDGYDMSINVGIGTGDKMQQLQMLGTIAQAQAMIVQGGGMGTLVTPQNIYNLQKKNCELNGFKNAGDFFTDPSTVPPKPPPPPPPEMVMKQAELQHEAQAGEMKLAAEDKLAAEQRAFDAQQAQLDRQLQIVLKTMENQQATKKQLIQGEFDAGAREFEVQNKEEKESGESNSLNGLLTTMAQVLQVLAAPKQVIRDENGRPVAVAPVMETPGGQ